MRRALCFAISVMMLAAAMGTCLTGCGSESEASATQTTQTTQATQATLAYAELSDEEYFATKFEPILRFVVCSDVHIDDTGTQTQQARYEKMCQVAYDYTDAQDDGVDLAAILVAGDVSDSGTLASMQIFFRLANNFLRGDTIVRAILGNHEFYHADTEALFLYASGYDSVDSHLVIEGYHFIMVSPNMNGKGYDTDKQEWLAEQLKEAAAEDPTGTKPIFVFQHHHVSDTVYGSVRWGTDDLRDVLDEYPQVVDFSGHSHFPIDDPTSVWQGTFTALGTGTLSYSEVGIAGLYDDSVWAIGTEGAYTTTSPWEGGGSNEKDIAQFYIVEVDANNAIKIQGYDLLSDSFFMDPILLRSVGNPDTFVYTDDRAEKSEKPYFAEDAEAVPESVDGLNVTLRFPQAISADNVQNYRCELWQGDELIDTVYRLSCTFYTPAPETLTVPFTLPAAGTYQVRIYGVNSFAVSGDVPLTYELTV